MAAGTHDPESALDIYYSGDGVNFDFSDEGAIDYIYLGQNTASLRRSKVSDCMTASTCAATSPVVLFIIVAIAL